MNHLKNTKDLKSLINIQSTTKEILTALIRKADFSNR